MRQCYCPPCLRGRGKQRQGGLYGHTFRTSPAFSDVGLDLASFGRDDALATILPASHQCADSSVHLVECIVFALGTVAVTREIPESSRPLSRGGGRVIYFVASDSPRMRLVSWMSLTMIVIRREWIAQRLLRV